MALHGSRPWSRQGDKNKVIMRNTETALKGACKNREALERVINQQWQLGPYKDSSEIVSGQTNILNSSASCVAPSICGSAARPCLAARGPCHQF